MIFEHLRESRMSYCQHLYNAITYSLKSFIISVIFLIHGIYPDIFKTTGSEMTNDLLLCIRKNNHNLILSNSGVS